MTYHLPTARRTPFTRLDFRAKLALMTAITFAAFLWESPRLNATLAASVAVACLMAGIRAAYLRRVLLLITPFALIVLTTQGFWAGDMLRARLGGAPLTPVWRVPSHWWGIGGAVLSREGLGYALAVIAKMVTMTLVIPLGVFTTDVQAMIVGLVRLGLPYRVAFVFSSALRFFPMLLNEIEAIIEAQRLRGLAPERMGPLRRVRFYGRIAVPLILGVMVRAQTLEIALQAKAFAGDGRRTFLDEAHLRGADYALLGASGCFVVVILVAYLRWGVGKFGGPL